MNIMEFFKNLFGKKKETIPSKLALEGEVLRIKGEFKKALKNFDKAIESEPDNDMYYYSRSSVKLGLKDIKGALSDIEKAISLKPSVNAYKDLKNKLQEIL